MRIGSAKESYAADTALFDSRAQRAWVCILAAAMCVFPFMVDEYWLYLACLVAINVASTSGLNVLTGYTGLVSLGQGRCQVGARWSRREGFCWQWRG